VKTEVKKEVKVDKRTKLQKLVDEKTKENVMIGRVLKLINQNYGLGVCIKRTKDGFSELVQVLFDVFDVWRGDAVLSTLNKKLPNELAVRQFLLVNAISIEKKENVKRNVEFMATAVVGAESIEDLKIKRFPAGAVLLKNADKLDANKINNFKAVVNVVNNMDLDGQEKELVEEIEQELLSQQKPLKEPELKPTGIKEELADEQKHKPDVPSSPDLPQRDKNSENIPEEKEQKLVLKQKPHEKAEEKLMEGHKEELIEEHKPEPQVASSSDLVQIEDVGPEEGLEERHTKELIEEHKPELQVASSSDLVQNEDVGPEEDIAGIPAHCDAESSDDAVMDQFEREIFNDSESSDFEMPKKKRK